MLTLLACLCSSLQQQGVVLGITERCALASSRPTIWRYRRHSDPGWTASPIRPDMNFRKGQACAVQLLSVRRCLRTRLTCWPGINVGQMDGQTDEGADPEDGNQNEGNFSALWGILRVRPWCAPSCLQFLCKQRLRSMSNRAKNFGAEEVPATPSS